MHFSNLHRLLTDESPGFRILVTHHVASRDLSAYHGLVRRLLAANEVLQPSDVVEYATDLEFELPRESAIAFTFDDGLRSSAEAVASVLEPLNVGAVFFVPTAILELRTPSEMLDFAWRCRYFKKRDRDTIAPDQYETLTRKSLVRLRESGHVIAPHTHTHARLDSIRTAGDLQRELIQPTEILRSVVGDVPKIFAYPVGTERVVSRAAYASVRDHFSACFTSLRGKNTVGTNRYYIRRDEIQAYYSERYVAQLLDGALDPFYAAKLVRLQAATNPLRPQNRHPSRP